MTLRFRLDPDHLDRSVIAEAAAVIRSGGLVAFPTETVYGLGAGIDDESGVRRVFEAKERPADDPLIVHVLGGWPLEGIAAEVPPTAGRLIERFWPGPLTLVLPRGPRVPEIVTAGLDTVAVRAPAHPVAEALLEAAGVPIAAPSANRFGHVSPTSADHVLADLAGRCDVVLDAGDTVLGLESTVVAVETDGRVVVLRHGALPVEDLDVPVVEAEPHRDRSRAPGRAVRHYSPSTELRVVEAGAPSVLPEVATGVYLGYDDAARPVPPGWRFVTLGSRDALGAVAARLYRVLRAVDSDRPDLIVAELTGRPGLGRAIDDRLTRAASGRHLG